MPADKQPTDPVLVNQELPSEPKMLGTLPDAQSRRFPRWLMASAAAVVLALAGVSAANWWAHRAAPASAGLPDAPVGALPATDDVTPLAEAAASAAPVTDQTATATPSGGVATVPEDSASASSDATHSDAETAEAADTDTGQAEALAMPAAEWQPNAEALAQEQVARAAAEDQVAALQKTVADLQAEVLQLRAANTYRADPELSAPLRAAAAKPRTRPIHRRPARRAAPAVAEQPKPQPRLLAIDVWDGKPSVVVGTTAPDDRDVRTLQLGESINGITLRSVDTRAGRATFDVGDGRLASLSLGDAQ